MQADNLQKYILTLSSKIKKESLKENKSNTEYHQAIEDVLNLLDTERQEVIASYQFLKERGAL